LKFVSIISKSFDLKNGLPDKRELGNKYNLLTNYKNHEIYREDSRTRIKITTSRTSLRTNPNRTRE